MAVDTHGRWPWGAAALVAPAWGAALARRGDETADAARRIAVKARGERLRTRLEHGLDRRSVPLAVWLLRVTRGRMARLWRRRVLVLNVRGRRSGRPRPVPLQYFPDGEAMVVAAANSGLPTPPAWYLNLLADPAPSVDVDGRRLAVRAERMSALEAAAFWPKLLEIAPDYERYRRRTTREIPLVRLSAA